MSQTTVELIIGAVTVVISTVSTAFICGMFMGGLRAKIEVMADRLAKIEGMFTLVPVQTQERDKEK